jgi:serine/threonine-protein kinase
MNLTAGVALQNGKYLLSSLLSRDGLSLTFKATRTDLNQPIVLKTIQPHPQVPIDFVQLKQRFCEAARLFLQYQHPTLATVLEVFEVAGLPFVAIEYVNGQSLAELVQTQGPFPEVQALQYIRQAASALSLLHQHGLVHLDVKPQNLIRPLAANCVVLVDYGIASAALLGIQASPCTLPVGPYAAIEQTRLLETPLPATDIYALSASLYFLLTGKEPPAALQRHRTPLIAPRHLQPNLRPAVEATILKGMELEQKARPQTIAAWLSLLTDAEPLSLTPEFSQRQAIPVAEVVLPSLAAPSVPPPATPPPITASLAPDPSPTTQTPTVVPLGTRYTSRSPKAVVKWRKKPIFAVGTIAALVGVGAGLALRINGATGPGSTIFHTEQAFPPKETPGTTESVSEPFNEPRASEAPKTRRSAPIEAAPSQPEYEPEQPPPSRRSSSSSEPDNDSRSAEPPAASDSQALPSPVPTPTEVAPANSNPLPAAVEPATPPVTPPAVPPPTPAPIVSPVAEPAPPPPAPEPTSSALPAPSSTSQ